MAKLSIDKESLVAIGDALRVHFGDAAQEGTTVFQEESPRIIKTSNYDDLSTSENNGEWIAAIDSNWDQVLVDTIKIHGASKIVLKLAYRTDSDLTTGGIQYDWFWLAEGAYRYVEPKKGKKIQYRDYESWRCLECGSPVRDTGEKISIGIPVVGGVPGSGGVAAYEPNYNREQPLLKCDHCGLEGFGYDYNSIDPTIPPIYIDQIGSDTGYTFDNYICKDGTLSYDFEFLCERGMCRKIDTFTFNGDTFTFAICIKERTQETGYYGEIYAYDADGNELDCYEVTTGYLPNTYSPDPSPYTSSTMAAAIAKLNNYPNGEEVQF